MWTLFTRTLRFSYVYMYIYVQKIYTHLYPNIWTLCCPRCWWETIGILPRFGISVLQAFEKDVSVDEVYKWGLRFPNCTDASTFYLKFSVSRYISIFFSNIPPSSRDEIKIQLCEVVYRYLRWLLKSKCFHNRKNLSGSLIVSFFYDFS